jgi:hypothetical protein
MSGRFPDPGPRVEPLQPEWPRGGGPDPADNSGSTAESRSRELHEANLAVQRRSRIESRRRRIGWLRGHVFPEGSRFAEQYAREIELLESEIRAEGEEP